MSVLTFAQAAYMSQSRGSVYMAQIRDDIPYGDILAMVTIAKAEGATVTQINDKAFLVNNTAWVNYAGYTTPVETTCL